MSLRRRTLSFVLIFLSLNNGPVFVASLNFGRAINAKPVLSEYRPSLEATTPQFVNSLLTVGSANRALQDVLPAGQNIFPERFGPYTQGVSVNTASTSNYAVPNPSSSYLSPLNASPSSHQISPPFSDSPSGLPSQIESLTVIDQNYSPVTQTIQVEGFAPSASAPEVSSISSSHQTPISVQVPSMPQLSPFFGIARPVSGILPPQNIFREFYTPNVVSDIYTPNVVSGIYTPNLVPEIYTPNVVSEIYTPNVVSEIYTPNVESEIYTPNVVSEICTPNVVSEIYTPNVVSEICTPNVVSEIHTPNVVSEIYTPNVVTETCTTNLVPEIYPQFVDTEINTLTSVPVETTNLAIPTTDISCSGQPLPISLQINMATPCVPEPIIAVISQSPPPPNNPFNSPPSGIPPYPLIVMEKSRSKLKSLLPILLISLFDGGCRNGGGGCCSQCSSGTPFPFPIVIPTCNSIVTGGSRSCRGKKKCNTDYDETEA